jgi:hypothetical protein
MILRLVTIRRPEYKQIERLVQMALVLMAKAAVWACRGELLALVRVKLGTTLMLGALAKAALEHPDIGTSLGRARRSEGALV